MRIDVTTFIVGIAGAPLLTVCAPAADRATEAAPVQASGDTTETALADAEAPSEAEPEAKIVWRDEFDKDGPPDPAKWSYEEGFVRNAELQYYTKERRENARVENGVLVLQARKERWPNPRYDKRANNDWQRERKFADYTASSIHTNGKASFTYGRVEVRAKVPNGRGTWPAIWMLGTNIGEVGWPRCGEIDIMEHVGYEPAKVHTTVHTDAYNHAKGTSRGHSLDLGKPYEDFHVYAVDWSKSQISFSVDGHKVFAVVDDGGGDASWPFYRPQYLLLNLAIGGAWGGQKGVDDSLFPHQFLIDYVRVYEAFEEKPRKSDVARAAHTAPGLAYRYYEGSWDRVPAVQKLQPTASGVAPRVSLDVRKRDDHFALVFSGYIEVASAGKYRFYTESDDGSELWIGNELVVPNDGVHRLTERVGEIELAEGKHAISILYFEQGGEQNLRALVQGPNLKKQEIPGALLSHDPKAR